MNKNKSPKNIPIKPERLIIFKFSQVTSVGRKRCLLPNKQTNPTIIVPIVTLKKLATWVSYSFDILPKVTEVVEKLHGDEKIGGKIILRALEEPTRQISINAGLEPSVILEKVKNSPVGVGFNAQTDEYVDMKKAGIVDPTKVSRSALQNAVSIASMILTTESLVTDKKEANSCKCSDHEPTGMDGMY